MARRSIELGLVLSTLIGLGVACGTDSGTPRKRTPPPAAGGEGGDSSGAAGNGTPTGGTAPSGRPRTRVPDNGGGMGGEPPSDDGGVGGNAGESIVSPVACLGDPGVPPVDETCGDGFRAPSEECDDGSANAADSCTSMCRVRDSLSLASPTAGIEQQLGSGRHPLAAGCSGAALAFTERDPGSVAVVDIGLARFNRQGVPLGVTRDVNEGSTPAAAANPVVAELGSNAFAVAWTDIDGDGDGAGVALRRVVAESGALGPLVFANETTFVAQSDPDLLWASDALVAAWVDYSNPRNAADLKVRRFDTNLEPLGAEESLATTSRHEADVALASFGNSWAAAWRSSAEGLETIEVRAGSSSWTVGPFLPGAAGDRPALVELDHEHLLLVFTEGTAPPPSTDDLIGWWKLDGDGIDSSGGGHHLTNEGASPASGRIGLGMEFDGTSCMTAPIWDEARMQGASGMTIMAWVNPSDQIVCPLPPHGMTIAGRGWDYSMGAHCYSASPDVAATGSVRTVEMFNVGWGYPGGWGGMYPNQWTHVAITWDHAATTIYFNGEPVIGYPVPGAFGDIEPSFAVGCMIAHYWTGSERIQHFRGTVDDALLYRRVLSPEEIESYYSSNSVPDVPRLRGAILGAPGPTPSFPIAPRVSPFDEDVSLGQDQPNVLRAGDRIYVSWRSSAVASDPLGEEVWLKEVGVTFNGSEVMLDLGMDEIPLPRSDAHRTGDQRSPALFPVPIPFGTAIAAAWMDYGPFGTVSSAPGPVVEFIPTPILRLAGEE